MANIEFWVSLISSMLLFNAFKLVWILSNLEYKLSNSLLIPAFRSSSSCGNVADAFAGVADAFTGIVADAFTAGAGAGADGGIVDVCADAFTGGIVDAFTGIVADAFTGVDGGVDAFAGAGAGAVAGDGGIITDVRWIMLFALSSIYVILADIESLKVLNIFWVVSCIWSIELFIESYCCFNISRLANKLVASLLNCVGLGFKVFKLSNNSFTLSWRTSNLESKFFNSSFFAETNM